MDDNAEDVPLYAVVSFTETTTESVADIDLVPWQWLIELEDSKWICRYPPYRDYALRDKWLIEMKEAEGDWELYAVEIISKSSDLKQGRRRLKRAYRSRCVDTDADITAVPVASQPSLTQIGKFDDFTKEKQPATLSRGSHSKTPLVRTRAVSIVTEEANETAKGTEEIAVSNKQHELNEEMKAYLDAKFEELHVYVQRDISSAKRSILYDLNNKIDSIKNTLVAMNPGTQAICANATEFREALDVALLVKTVEGFLNFEQMLNEHDGKKDALRALYQVLIFGETTAKGCIAKIMSATLTKAVESMYSGTGRKIHGKGKLNFSETQTFNCLQEVITQKFSDSQESKGLAGKVGRWLSGTVDREGGRKQRDGIRAQTSGDIRER